MVLGVGLEVVQVDGGQAGDEQLQLLLVEHRDQVLRDDVVEALQERLELLLDGARHLHLADESHVLHLVLLRHLDVASPRLQVAHLVHTELLDVRAECQLVAHLRDVVLDQVHQTCEEKGGAGLVT